MEKVNRVVLFGAGASHGAREPRPPLGKGLHCYVRKYLLKAWTELREIEDGDGSRTDEIRKKLEQRLKNESSFEYMADKLLAEEEKDLPGKLNYLMACALTPPINDDPRVDDAFIEQPDIYDEFLRSRFSSREKLEKAAFITLNYDCLLERAICRFLNESQDGEDQCLCKHVNYWLTEDGSGIEVLKPHGSINWVHVTSDYGPLKNNCIPTDRVEPDEVMSWTNIKSFPSPKGRGDGDDIVLAHYAPGKKAQANPGTLLKIRKLALKRVENADVIEVIGVHLPTDPTDDPFLSEILDLMKNRVMAGICKVDHITPDPLEIEKARSTFNFNPIQETFGEYVDKQKGYRKIQ